MSEFTYITIGKYHITVINDIVIIDVPDCYENRIYGFSVNIIDNKVFWKHYSSDTYFVVELSEKDKQFVDANLRQAIKENDLEQVEDIVEYIGSFVNEQIMEYL